MIGVTSESASGLPRVRISGSLSVRELSVLIEQYQEHDAPETACLVDLSGATATGLDFRDVRKLAQLSLRRGLPRPGMRVGVVAPNPVTYGVCRMLQGLRGDLDEGLGVFSTEDEATAWIRRGKIARA